MSQITDFVLERIEFYGALFFNSITPEFLLIPEMDFTKMTYQFSMGVIILAVTALTTIFLVDRSQEKRQEQESKRMVRIIRQSFASATGSITTDSALEVMRERQRKQSRDSRGRLETASYNSVNHIKDDHLPTFFKK